MKKKTVTIAIPALNEEQNIEGFLRSILAQKLQTVKIEKLLIYSDASTDKTHEIVTHLERQFPVIKLIKGKTRKGKYARMNDMFASCMTDVLIVMDADIAMVGDSFIETLAKSLLSDPKALTVSAHNIFVRPKGFVAKVLHAHFTMWDSILLGIPHFEAASQFSGTATAFRGSYVRTLHIPATVTNPHLFLYLDPKSKNGFRFCTKAQILQYTPSTIHEVKMMLVRAISKPDEMLDEMFGREMIHTFQYVPRRTKLIVVLKSFLQNPLYTPFGVIMTVYISRLGSHSKKSKSQLWGISTSTKKPLATA